MTTTLGSMGSQDSRTDKDADFSAYMSARQPALYRTAYLLAGDHAGAEDLLQNAFAMVSLSWDKIRDRGALDGYVRRIMVNEHNSLWRRAWKRREHATDTMPDSGIHDTYDDGLVQRLPGGGGQELTHGAELARPAVPAGFREARALLEPVGHGEHREVGVLLVGDADLSARAGLQEEGGALERGVEDARPGDGAEEVDQGLGVLSDQAAHDGPQFDRDGAGGEDLGAVDRVEEARVAQLRAAVPGAQQIVDALEMGEEIGAGVGQFVDAVLLEEGDLVLEGCGGGHGGRHAAGRLDSEPVMATSTLRGPSKWLRPWESVRLSMTRRSPACQGKARISAS